MRDAVDELSAGARARPLGRGCNYLMARGHTKTRTLKISHKMLGQQPSNRSHCRFLTPKLHAFEYLLSVMCFKTARASSGQNHRTPEF